MLRSVWSAREKESDDKRARAKEPHGESTSVESYVLVRSTVGKSRRLV